MGLSMLASYHIHVFLVLIAVQTGSQEPVVTPANQPTRHRTPISPSTSPPSNRPVRRAGDKRGAGAANSDNAGDGVEPSAKRHKSE